MHKKVNTFFNIVIHVLEYVIAIITLAVLLWVLGREIIKMFSVENYLSEVNDYLNSILTIVVGLEFVRMLINLTPANTLEVLIVAIARQVILNHTSSVNNIICVVCIAGLFAIRRFLIPKTELKIELSDSSEDSNNN